MWARSSTAISLSCVVLAAACSRSGGGTGAQSKKDQPLRIAAASDLSGAFTELGKAFEEAHGRKVEFSFGSTGLLAKQIEQGAPFDAFAAANVSFVDEAVKAGACDGATKRMYAQGRLAIWAKDEAHLPKSVADLRDPKYAKIAIANPEHAPYGKAAEQALEKAGVWDAAKSRMVYGSNIQQTFMFGESGNADVALVALSVALKGSGKYVLVDESLHDPLEQAIVVCNGGAAGGRPNEAKDFLDFVGSEAGHAIMKKYGFLLPGETLPPK